MWKVFGAVIAAMLLVSSQAQAQDPIKARALTSGTVAMFGGNPAWAKEMTDEEMAGLRGGFAGFSFSAFFAIFDALNVSVGTLASNVEILSTPGTTPTGTVEAFTSVGLNVPDFNFSGVGQFASVEGNFNTVLQGAFININVFNNGAANSINNLNNIMTSTQGLN